MDIEARCELAKLIKQITETGDWTLDDITLKVKHFTTFNHASASLILEDYKPSRLKAYASDRMPMSMLLLIIGLHNLKKNMRK